MQQNNSNGQQSVPGPRPVASSVGLPVQVFPTGPPPPPPVPTKSHLAPQPPAAPRPSPVRSPQNFEPPPMGCRPEIKIPANPMAALRKVPKPEPKNDFWIEEYRTERSKSPMVGNGNTSREQSTAPSGPEEANIPEPVRQYNDNKSGDTTDGSKGYTENRKSNPIQLPADSWNGSYSNENQNSFSPSLMNGNADSVNSKPILSQQDRINSPFTTSSSTPPNLPKPLSPIKSAQEPDTQYYVRQIQPRPQQNAQNTVQNQWPPLDTGYARVTNSPARSINPIARVAQSPARVVQSPARVVSPPPRVMSPQSRVMSPPPVPKPTNNARNVRPSINFYFYNSLINGLSCNSAQLRFFVYSTKHT